VLIDNLDKPWTKKADIAGLTQFLLGLLTAAERVSEELRHGERNRNATRYNSAIFIRSDIFDQILEATDEPDKISHSRLSWNDPELLLRVIEERYVASHGPTSNPALLWHKYFCAQVKSLPTRQYIVARILPRPRDMVYLVKAAVSFAVNRKHDRVEEKDVLDGEKQYSQYAWDSILVENSATIPQLDNVMLQFVGGSSTLSESQVRHLVSSAGMDPVIVDEVISQLVKLTFLGVEVANGRFEFSDEWKELQKNAVLATRFAGRGTTERRYAVNTPFRAYLEIDELEGVGVEGL